MSMSNMSTENSLGEEDKIQQQSAASDDGIPEQSLTSRRKQQGGSTEVTKKQSGKVIKTKQSKLKIKKHEGTHPGDLDTDGQDNTGLNWSKSPSIMDTKSSNSGRGSEGGTTGEGANSVTATSSKAKAGDRDAQMNGGVRPPSASSSKPSIAGIVGARKLGVKWRQMIGNGATNKEEQPGAAVMIDDSETFPPGGPRRAK